MNKWTYIFIGGLVASIISFLILYIYLSYILTWISIPFILLDIKNIPDLIFIFITSWIVAIPIGCLIGYILWKIVNRNN